MTTTWTIQQINLDPEMRLLCALITSHQLNKHLLPLVESAIFEASSNRIAFGWIQNYSGKFPENPAPKKAIFDLLRKKTFKDSGEFSAFIKFLKTKRFKAIQTNFDYELEQNKNFIRRRKIELLIAKLEQGVGNNNLDSVENEIAVFRRVDVTKSFGFDLRKDYKDIIREVFAENEKEELFSMPGAIGKLHGKFHRGELWAFVARMKVGKTWFLLEAAKTAFLQGHSVLFVSLEMSEARLLQRFIHMLTALPTAKHAGTIAVPIFDCALNQTQNCKNSKNRNKASLYKNDQKPKIFDASGRLIKSAFPLDYIPCFRKQCLKKQPAVWYKLEEFPALTEELAFAKLEAIKDHFNRGSFRVVQFPNKKITMGQLEVYIDNLALYENFVPSVIITDYIDKFRPSSEKQEYRHQINEITEAHKALAQDRNCLVLTASQPDGKTARDEKANIRQGSWAEDIRKLAIIDGGIAINQTPEEKRIGIYRLGVIANRHEEFDVLGEAMVLQCLKIGRPCLVSTII